MQVLSLERILNAERVSMASTMLNICANMSKQSKHDEALDYANEAILTLENYLIQTKKQRNVNLHGDEGNGDLQANFWSTL